MKVWLLGAGRLDEDIEVEMREGGGIRLVNERAGAQSLLLLLHAATGIS